VSIGELVLSLADNKQLLGLRYAEWATRAPSLEADIAAAAMGLDDIGHSRVLLGCLEPLGEAPRAADRENDAGAYLNLPYLDQPWTTWGHFVAANAVLDTAFTAMIQACVELMEERYHFLHGRSWLREGIAPEPLEVAWREAVEWFGPPDGEVARLHQEGQLAAGPAELLHRVEERLEMKAPSFEPDWGAWDPRRRRSRPGAIDARTFGMLRGLEERKFMPSGASRGA